MLGKKDVGWLYSPTKTSKEKHTETEKNAFKVFTPDSDCRQLHFLFCASEMGQNLIKGLITRQNRCH